MKTQTISRSIGLGVWLLALLLPLGWVHAEEPIRSPGGPADLGFRQGSHGDPSQIAPTPGTPPGSNPMNEEQFRYIRIAASTLCVLLLLVVIELVRRRKLRIEYSWLWILTTGSMLVLAVWYDLLIKISRLIFLKGANEPVSPRETLYLFGMVFLLCICLHYSVKISQLTDQVKILVQELSLDRARRKKNDPNPDPAPDPESKPK